MDKLPEKENRQEKVLDRIFWKRYWELWRQRSGG